jgi:hypothetical protein
VVIWGCGGDLRRIVLLADNVVKVKVEIFLLAGGSRGSLMINVGSRRESFKNM